MNSYYVVCVSRSEDWMGHVKRCNVVRKQWKKSWGILIDEVEKGVILELDQVFLWLKSENNRQKIKWAFYFGWKNNDAFGRFDAWEISFSGKIRQLMWKIGSI